MGGFAGAGQYVRAVVGANGRFADVPSFNGRVK